MNITMTDHEIIQGLGAPLKGLNLKYKCPYCGKEHEINDCVVEKILAKSKHISTKYRSRLVIRTYRDSYYYVRVCHKCHKKKKITLYTLQVLFFVVCPILYTLHYFKTSNNGIGNYLGVILCVYFLCYLIYLIVGSLIAYTMFPINFEKANKDNAILSPLEVLKL